MSGYMHCTCRDCFETIVGEPGDYCDGCEEAGCPGYQGLPGLTQECQRPDAYGCDDDDTNGYGFFGTHVTDAAW